MKKQILNLFTIAALGLAVVGCKKAKEANTKEVEVVAVSEVTAEKYIADKVKSSIAWKGFKPTGTHDGTVNIESGVFVVENGTVKSGTFLIDMKSIVVLDLEGEKKDGLESHLKGTVEGKEDHFFNVNTFPTGVFEVTGTEIAEDGKTMLSGNLGLKGQKHNVTFPVSITVEGDSVIIASETFTIDRTKWGVNYSSKTVFDDLGDRFINDDMELKITIKATKA